MANQRFKEVERTFDPEMDLDKMFRGAYVYSFNGAQYSDEVFTVYRDADTNNYLFKSETHSRISNGEFLIIQCETWVAQNLYPISTLIKKNAGKIHITELYKMNKRKNELTYNFDDGNTSEQCIIHPPPLFQVSTPSIVTSFLFVGGKKYDSTSRNYHHIIKASNIWEYNDPPKSESLSLVMPSASAEEIRIKGKKLKGMKYLVFKSDDYDPSIETPLSFHLSKYLYIPYLITHGDLRIEISFLNNLSKQDDD